MKTFILCGGYGSRLKPFTYLIPKPFLTTNNVSPFEYSLNNILKTTNSGTIFVTAYYKKEFVKNALKKKSKKIKLLIEKEPMGTAGSLRLISKQSKSRNLIVTNGDIFSKVDFKKLIESHNRANTDMTICIKSHNINIPYAVMTKKDNKIDFKEKPTLVRKINAGIYIIKKEFLINFFKKNKSIFLNMNQIFESIKDIGVFDIGNRWIDIGHINDFKRAYNEIKKW